MGLLFNIFNSDVVLCTSVCICIMDWVSKRWRDSVRLWCVDRQMVSFTVSWGLPLHTPLHLLLPISLLSVIHCTLTCTPAWFAILISSSHSLSSLHACLLCWLHVKCQVQSQLTDLLWHVCGCKTSKVLSPIASLSATSLLLSPGLSASVKLLLFKRPTVPLRSPRSC